MSRATGFVLAATFAAAIACSSCSTAPTTADAPPPEAMTTQVHDVRDLTLPRPQVPPATDEPAEPFVEIANLVSNLVAATDTQYWQAEGTAIRTEESGYLQVTASPRMQGQIQKVLADLRVLAAKKT